MATPLFQKILNERRKIDGNQTQTSKKNNYLKLVEARMAEKGKTKAQAMRMVTREHPDLHAVWIEEVNR